MIWDGFLRVICFAIQRTIENDIFQVNSSYSSVVANLLEGKDNKQSDNEFTTANAEEAVDGMFP
jgi:hypothetical protein